MIFPVQQMSFIMLSMQLVNSSFSDESIEASSGNWLGGNREEGLWTRQFEHTCDCSLSESHKMHKTTKEMPMFVSTNLARLKRY